jgi:hypothetical protein
MDTDGARRSTPVGARGIFVVAGTCLYWRGLGENNSNHAEHRHVDLPCARVEALTASCERHCTSKHRSWKKIGCHEELPVGNRSSTQVSSVRDPKADLLTAHSEAGAEVAEQTVWGWRRGFGSFHRQGSGTLHATLEYRRTAPKMHSAIWRGHDGVLHALLDHG